MRTHTASTARDASGHDDVLSVSTVADGDPAPETLSTTSAGATTMGAIADAHRQHHEMPACGGALTRVALSATLHCLTGCAIGEVLGMVIGTALGFSDLGTIALAVALAFLFGYALTSLPLLRAGFALSAVIPIALAADTLSIAVMEIVDNAIMLLVPGAMGAGLDASCSGVRCHSRS